MLFYVVTFNLKHQHTNFTLGQYILIFKYSPVFLYSIFGSTT